MCLARFGAPQPFKNLIVNGWGSAKSNDDVDDNVACLLGISLVLAEDGKKMSKRLKK